MSQLPSEPALVALMFRRLLLSTALILGALVFSSGPMRAHGDELHEVPAIVVTTEVLGSVVADIVGDAAEVSVLMPGGADPHTWQPSARDTESLFDADLIIANGLGLEEGLVHILDRAAADYVPPSMRRTTSRSGPPASRTTMTMMTKHSGIPISGLIRSPCGTSLCRSDLRFGPPGSRSATLSCAFRMNS